MSRFVSMDTVFSFSFRCSSLNCLFSLAISLSQFGRPGDWPVSFYEGRESWHEQRCGMVVYYEGVLYM